MRSLQKITIATADEHYIHGDHHVLAESCEINEIGNAVHGSLAQAGGICTSAELCSESTFSAFDFETVRFMTEEGPRLREAKRAERFSVLKNPI